jgi:serine/threonine-protein kinase
LAKLAWVVAGGFWLGGILTLVRENTGLITPVYWVGGAISALSALWLGGSGRLVTRLWLARAYLVTVAFLLALMEAGDSSGAQTPSGISRVCLLVVLTPSLLPTGQLWYTGLLCLAIAATLPAAYLVLLSVGHMPGSVSALPALLVGDIVTLLIAVFPALALARLKEDSLQAHEMGSYRLTQPIGEGGMGEVWQAQHIHLKRPAAIKFVHRSLLIGDDQEAYARFVQEGRLLASLRSPHTLQIFDFGACDDGRLYLATEYLQGYDLETLVRRYGPLSPGRVVNLLIQTCDALEEAHALHIIHRDIKPANLFVSYRLRRGDWLKVLDFGLADLAYAQNVSGRLLGTPEYMSPEQLQGLPIDSRSDIYSLGCVAHFLLSGSVPYLRGTMDETIAAHLYHDPQPLPEHCPETLQAVISRCLSKNPGLRPRDVRELSHQLAVCLPAYSWTYSMAESWWQTRMPEESIGAKERDLWVARNTPTTN